MINWKELGKLHVVSKLDTILGKWFNVELLYTDTNLKIRSEHFEKDYQFRSQFLKMYSRLDFGRELIAQDVENFTQILSHSKDDIVSYQSFFPHVRGIAARLTIDGEVVGSVVAYPFLMDNLSSAEIDELKLKLKECGTPDADIDVSIASIKRLTDKDLDYFKELVGLVAEEVTTYHGEISKREQRIHELNSELGNKYRYHMMVGKSKPMQQIYRLLEKISNSDSSVFIQGENGTGKELVAKAVHFYSPRKDKVFLAVNCSAFNDNLLDSELFGHVKGAFTGAVKDKKGLFESADGGTLFLDEIGDTSLSMQVKLLRVLQEGTFMPVGGATPRKSDVRIIAATNRNLKEMMAKGEFREDLYYRINVININIPSLRERKEDIPLLMDHFMQKRCGESGLPLKTLSKKCLEKMLDYPWPGNVRELENEIERLVVLAGEEKTIMPELLSARILDFGVDHSVSGKGIDTSGSLKDALEELEIIMIREGLKRCNFNKSKLAKELGISRASLIMKVEKYELDKRSKARLAATGTDDE